MKMLLRTQEQINSDTEKAFTAARNYLKDNGNKQPSKREEIKEVEDKLRKVKEKKKNSDNPNERKNL